MTRDRLLSICLASGFFGLCFGALLALAIENARGRPPAPPPRAAAAALDPATVVPIPAGWTLLSLDTPGQPPVRFIVRDSVRIEGMLQMDPAAEPGWNEATVMLPFDSATAPRTSDLRAPPPRS